MPGFDGNGNFTRYYSWEAHAAAGTNIEADLHDDEDDNFALAFNKTFCRDGQAAATGDFDMDGRKIANLGEATLDGDALALGKVTGAGAYPPFVFKKGPDISGSYENGRLTFSSPTGVTGFAWLGADLSLLAKLFRDDQTRNRLVLNNVYAPHTSTTSPGSDVMILDDLGNLQVTSLTANLSNSQNDGLWRTIAPGYGMRAIVSSTGITLQGNTTATLTDAYVAATLENRITLATSGGSATIRLSKDSEGNNKTCDIFGYRDDNPRWLLRLGNPTAETANKGSDYYLYRYNDAGTAFAVMSASRETGEVTVHAGRVYCDIFESISTHQAIFGGTGVILRPNSSTSSQGEVNINTSGYIRAGHGIYEKAGTSGSQSAGTQIHNSWYAASNDLRWYIGTGIVGYYTPACDHRIKRDIRPLPSAWDAVKKLRPVIFKDAAWGEPDEMNPYKDGDEDRVGFLAYELQDALGRQAATGEKDGDAIQGPDVMAVVAAVTRTLQEAMMRIEALEGSA
jgi:hypothetical protein